MGRGCMAPGAGMARGGCIWPGTGTGMAVGIGIAVGMGRGCVGVLIVVLPARAL